MLIAYPLLALLAAMDAGAVVAEIQKPDDTIRIRTLNRSDAASPMQWEAVELLSEAALRETGALLDLDLSRWATACRTGLYTVFVLTDKTSGIGRAIAVVARKDGDRWVVDQAYGRSSAVAPADLVTLATAICAKIGASSVPVDLGAVEIETSAPSIEFDEVRVVPTLPTPTPTAPAPAASAEFEEVEPNPDVDDGTSSLILDDEIPKTSLDETTLDYGSPDDVLLTEESEGIALPI